MRYAFADGDEVTGEELFDVAKAVGIRIHNQEEPHIVALDDDEVVGGVASSRYTSERGDEWHFTVVVLPRAQSGGVGRELIRRFIADARSNDAAVVSADVVNPRLRAYLKRLGFEEVPAGPTSNGREMELVLE